MGNLLIVNSSPRSNSVSRRLTRHVAQEWAKRNPGSRITERDLLAPAIPFLSESWIQASTVPADQRTPEQQQALALSDELIDELMAADVIVLGVPMHNFSISAPLKAWFDLVTRAGKTFSYGEKGAQGLVPSDKKVIAVVSRGGVYGEGSPTDFQVPYLRYMLSFIGLTNVSLIDADRQAFGTDAAQQSVDHAVQQLTAAAEGYSAQLAAAE